MKNYDVVVVGGGHAGCEAGLVCARMGKKTLLVTMTLDAAARMSCNPAIGGLAKGHLVRELDALGGQMARNIDATGIQFRMLNRSKGPAVWAPRAQADKAAYSVLMKQVLEQEPNLELKEAETTAVLTSAGQAAGVCLSAGLKISAQAVIITTGTFLNGLI
ncbi:MAG: FAD-dependent oxidoreductase, partial [Candidatus Omnitrophica bacterium]|nr:FAD-dependent oxidoreductase [Candidatus Omnitrophota bacterium]